MLLEIIFLFSLRENETSYQFLNQSFKAAFGFKNVR